jgi:hypothetical protein
MDNAPAGVLLRKLIFTEFVKVFPTSKKIRKSFYGIYKSSPAATVIQSKRKRRTSIGCIFKPISVHVQSIFIGSEQLSPSR